MIPAKDASGQTVESARTVEAYEGPDRSGFSLLLTMGLGVQAFSSGGDSETGLAGLNLGIGGFVSPDMAVMFRVSGTNVNYGRSDLVSGFGGPALQYWANDSVNLETGLGFGILDSSRGWDERGWAMFLGVGYSFYHKNRTSFQLGIEYAPVILDGFTVHNVGLTFGWQLL